MLKLTSFEVKLLISFLIVGILSRTIFHFGENIEFITAFGIVSGYFFVNKKLSWIASFLIISLTDILIGNSSIFIFTWSAFLITPIWGILAQNLSRSMPKIYGAVFSSFGGIISTMFFFLWTNLGVVLLSTMYSKTISGLIQSYTNAIPFLIPQLLGNIIIVPLVFVVVNLLSYKKRFHNSLNTNVPVVG